MAGLLRLEAEEAGKTANSFNSFVHPPGLEPFDPSNTFGVSRYCVLLTIPRFSRMFGQ